MSLFLQFGPVREAVRQVVVKHMTVSLPVAQEGECLVPRNSRGPRAKIPVRIELVEFLPQHDDGLLERLIRVLTGGQHGSQQGVQSGLALREEAQKLVMLRIVEVGHGSLTYPFPPRSFICRKMFSVAVVTRVGESGNDWQNP